MTSKDSDESEQRLGTLKGKPRRERPFRLSRRAGGFRISGRADERHRAIEILVAYDRRSGSALRRYSTTDFRLDEQPVHIEAHGATFEIAEPNRMIVIPHENMFDVSVTGFDKNRDLFLQARPGRDARGARSVREELLFE